MARSSTSVAHQRAVVLPEAANGRLAGPEILRFRFVTAHHYDAGAVIVVLQCALHETTDAAVFHRDIAGGSNQVALAQPPFGHRLIVRVEAEMNPFKFGLVDAARTDDANRDRVAHLLQYHAREYR